MQDPAPPQTFSVWHVYLWGWSSVSEISVDKTNLVPWCPQLCPLRAHFLQVALSEEELAQLGGQEVATLSPTTRWEIRNISGVCVYSE